MATEVNRGAMSEQNTSAHAYIYVGALQFLRIFFEKDQQVPFKNVQSPIKLYTFEDYEAFIWIHPWIDFLKNAFFKL